MRKFFNFLVWLIAVLATMFIVNSCSHDDEEEQVTNVLAGTTWYSDDQPKKVLYPQSLVWLEFSADYKCEIWYSKDRIGTYEGTFKVCTYTIDGDIVTLKGFYDNGQDLVFVLNANKNKMTQTKGNGNGYLDYLSKS
jgi:hypothetical protein